MAVSAAAVFYLGNRFGPDPGRVASGAPTSVVPAGTANAVHEADPVGAVVERLARDASEKALGGTRGVIARIDGQGGFVGFRDRSAGGAYVAWHVSDDGAGGSWVRTLGNAAPAERNAALPEGLPDLGAPLMAVPIGQGRSGVMAVFRVTGSPEEAFARLDDVFGKAGWTRAADGGASAPLLYTRDRRRCLAGVTPAPDGPGCDVMILCDK